MYNKAKELMNGTPGSAVAAASSSDNVSVRAFMMAVKELHSIE
jgi:hypothetical protein